MENEEINKILANHLFGCKHKHHNPNTGACADCGNYIYEQQWDGTDYVIEWWLVIEKLFEIGYTDIEIRHVIGRGWINAIIDNNGKQIGMSGKTIGEAVCRCVVEYIKEREEHEQINNADN